MSVADRLTKLTTDITNAYTSIENKGGTIPANKNTNNLPTAIDSIEVIESATAEGESLSLTNTKAMPYSDYVIKGKSEQNTSTQGNNLFDEQYYNNSAIYSVNVYKYTLTKIKGNRGLFVKAQLKEGKTAKSGIYVCLSSTVQPNISGSIYRWFINDGVPDTNGAVFNTTDLYFSFYPSDTPLNKIFDNYNLWVSTDDINYEPFVPNSPSSEYPSEIHSVADDGTFTIDFEGQTENYNYTFITKPLSSLPNGVRDSLEADGIHRKIGIQTGTLSQTTTITLSDAKQNGAYMCNIKSAGTLTGKTIELEAGDYEIIYELAEEIIEPLTQNQATTMLDIIKTGSYEGTTNIYTDEDVKPTIGVGYYKKA